MSGLDLSNLSRLDAAVALRSFPRRYRAALLPIADDPDSVAMLTQHGPDGTSAMEAATQAALVLTMLDGALSKVMLHDDCVLPPGVLDERRRQGVEGPEPTIEHVLELITEATDSIAARADGGSSKTWQRTATVTGSAETVTALDLLREAVRVGSENLRKVTATLAALQ